jgi:hypothetical protein
VRPGAAAAVSAGGGFVVWRIGCRQQIGAQAKDRYRCPLLEVESHPGFISAGEFVIDDFGQAILDFFQRPVGDLEEPGELGVRTRKAFRDV